MAGLRRASVGFIAILSSCAHAPSFPWPARTAPERPTAAEVTTLGRYDRASSRVLMRRVLRPTRANLDYAANRDNRVTSALPPEVPVGAAIEVPTNGQLFGGRVDASTIVASLAETPLTPEERSQPMAFSPLVDWLSKWDHTKIGALEEARTGVRGESWGQKKSVDVVLQEIAEIYLHGSEAWVRIEFQPWARLFPEMPDEDGDGFPEIYGRLEPSALDETVLARIRDEYSGPVLDRAAVRGWANELASYWYPSFNTDLVDLETAWPPQEPAVLDELRPLEAAKPSVAIVGKPRGEAIYTVLLIDGLDAAATKNESVKRKPRTAAEVSADPQPLVATVRAELAQAGSWEKWAAAVEPIRKPVRSALKARPEGLKAFVGQDGYLFFRGSMSYAVSGDPRKQAPDKDPFATIVEFKKSLEAIGVDFLLVPVPSKEEIFVDRLPGVKSKPSVVINPWGRKLLLELAEAGVEVVDLLPPLLAARAADREASEPLYQALDTHWTNRGLQIAAELLAARIKKYPWADELSPVEYSTKRVEFTREGDLVSRLADRERAAFAPQTLTGLQVLGPDGALYDDDPSSPIVVLGDSFTGVYERMDCKGAGISAQVARLVRHPIDLVMSYGGGPNVRRALLSRGVEDLRSKRLVIWMFADRDFHDHWEGWEPLRFEE